MFPRFIILIAINIKLSQAKKLSAVHSKFIPLNFNVFSTVFFILFFSLYFFFVQQQLFNNYYVDVNVDSRKYKALTSNSTFQHRSTKITNYCWGDQQSLINLNYIRFINARKNNHLLFTSFYASICLWVFFSSLDILSFNGTKNHFVIAFLVSILTLLALGNAI